MRELNFNVTKEYNNRPLLHFLKGKVGLSQRIVQSLRHTKNSLFINEKPGRVIDKVSFGDHIKIYLPETTTPPLFWDKEINIIFEDEDILVINKEAGISSHPTINHQNLTLANAVANYLNKKENFTGAARAVGRLDKVTSGVIVFAKNAFAASKLNGNINKTYNALVYGKTEKEGTIDAPIIRPDINKTIRAIDENGDRAVTHYKTICQNEKVSFEEVQIETGRTHQIRLHFSHIGHPLIGDDMYGGAKTEIMQRAALHCREVTFIHPTKNKKVSYSAPLPEDIKKELINNGLTVDKI